MIGHQFNLPGLEPATQHFLDELGSSGALPLSDRSVARIRTALVALQTKPIGKPNASVEDMIWPVGPLGSIPVRIVRPMNTVGIVPVVMYFHGGGWVAGDRDTHDRLVREIAVAVQAAVVFVGFGRAPEVRFPIPVEEAFAATTYVVNNANSLNIDGSRLAVVGDGTGGNIAAALTLMCKQRRGPKILFQVLLYPPTAAGFQTRSYQQWRNGPWLTKQDMEWFWDMYLPFQSERQDALAAPLNATVDQLRGLPDALLITAEFDVLRDEGESYARKLQDAYVRTTCTRYIGMTHDFALLNALADTPATRGALGQTVAALRSAFA